MKVRLRDYRIYYKSRPGSEYERDTCVRAKNEDNAISNFYKKHPTANILKIIDIGHYLTGKR